MLKETNQNTAYTPNNGYVCVVELHFPAATFSGGFYHVSDKSRVTGKCWFVRS